MPANFGIGGYSSRLGLLSRLPSLSPESSDSSNPPDDEVTVSTDFHVTSIPNVCMILLSGTKIFANVAVLRNASPVFRAMLGPHFQEGQAIIDNPGCTQEIVFPDDDPKIMLTLAQLLHHRYQDAEGLSLDYKSIRDLAVLADKYDVCPVVKSALPALVNPEENSVQKLWYLICGAFIVGHRQIFRETSVLLLRGCSVSYLSLVDQWQTRREADLLIGALLEEKRAKLRCKISSKVVDDLDTIKLENPSFGEPDGPQNALYIAYGYPLSTTLEMLREAIDSDTLRSRATKVETYVKELDEEISKGICFDCVCNYGSHELHSAAKPKPKPNANP